MSTKKNKKAHSVTKKEALLAGYKESTKVEKSFLYSIFLKDGIIIKDKNWSHQLDSTFPDLKSYEIGIIYDISPRVRNAVYKSIEENFISFFVRNNLKKELNKVQFILNQKEVPYRSLNDDIKNMIDELVSALNPTCISSHQEKKKWIKYVTHDLDPEDFFLFGQIGYHDFIKSLNPKAVKTFYDCAYYLLKLEIIKKLKKLINGKHVFTSKSLTYSEDKKAEILDVIEKAFEIFNSSKLTPEENAVKVRSLIQETYLCITKNRIPEHIDRYDSTVPYQFEILQAFTEIHRVAFISKKQEFFIKYMMMKFDKQFGGSEYKIIEGKISPLKSE